MPTYTTVGGKTQNVRVGDETYARQRRRRHAYHQHFLRNSHAAGKYSSRAAPGYWDIIGEGKPIDTDKYS